MIVELISVGTELLLGNIVNTNAQYLSETCAKLGLNVYYQTTVGDNRERMTEVFRTALSRADLVIIGGGLGPTEDDITKDVCAELMGMPLVEDPEVRAHLEDWYRPPGFSIIAAFSRISCCRPAQRRTFSGLHSVIAVSSLRNIPSPEHGASTMIPSKNAGKYFVSRPESSFVTTAFRIPMRSIFCERIFARAGWISLLTRSPSPPSLAAACVDFPPGAAQRSRIISPGCGFKSEAAIIALGS